MKKSVGLAVVLLLVMSHLAFADPSIKPGIDVFGTVAGGLSYYDFAKNPVPAGFFCSSSAPFTSRVALKGLPIETGIPGQLRKTDTIIERMDEAVFDRQGKAETRIRFRALSMVSIAPIRTSCGAFHVYVTLDGRQPVTKMKIHNNHKNGGTFRAPLAANVRMTFVPVRGTNPRKLALKGRVEFPAVPIPWRFPDGKVLKPLESAVVDTNGDLRPDTRVPGTANFMAGYPPEIRSINAAGCYCVCHSEEGKYHCSATGGYNCSSTINCWE